MSDTWRAKIRNYYPVLRSKVRRYRVVYSRQRGDMSRVTFRLSEDDLQKIDAKAAECALTRSQYVRQTAVGIVPRSKFDKKVIHDLSLLHGDIGRVGGLLKLWLTNNEDSAIHQKLNVSELVLEIRQLKESINELIVKI